MQSHIKSLLMISWCILLACRTPITEGFNLLRVTFASELLVITENVDVSAIDCGHEQCKKNEEIL